MHRTSTEQLIISIYPSTFPSSSFPGPYLTSSEPTKASLLSKPKQCSIQSISRILPYQSPPRSVHGLCTTQSLLGVSPITSKYKSDLPPPTPREQCPLAAADLRRQKCRLFPLSPPISEISYIIPITVISFHNSHKITKIPKQTEKCIGRFF